MQIPLKEGIGGKRDGDITDNSVTILYLLIIVTCFNFFFLNSTFSDPISHGLYFIHCVSWILTFWNLLLFRHHLIYYLSQLKISWIIYFPWPINPITCTHPKHTFFQLVFHPFSTFPNHISLNKPIIAFSWKQRSVTKKNCKTFYTILINGKIESKGSLLL